MATLCVGNHLTKSVYARLLCYVTSRDETSPWTSLERKRGCCATWHAKASNFADFWLLFHDVRPPRLNDLQARLVPGSLPAKTNTRDLPVPWEWRHNSSCCSFSAVRHWPGFPGASYIMWLIAACLAFAWRHVAQQPHTDTVNHEVNHAFMGEGKIKINRGKRVDSIIVF